ncbi:MAG: hypothetical protein ACI8UR_001908, partial [Natronomonas sp.]
MPPSESVTPSRPPSGQECPETGQGNPFFSSADIHAALPRNATSGVTTPAMATERLRSDLTPEYHH